MYEVILSPSHVVTYSPENVRWALLRKGRVQIVRSGAHRAPVMNTSNASHNPSVLPRLLTIDELSEYLDVSRRTIDGWRLRGGGPPFVKFGKSVRYPEHALLQWLDEQMTGGGL